MRASGGSIVGVVGAVILAASSAHAGEPTPSAEPIDPQKQRTEELEREQLEREEREPRTPLPPEVEVPVPEWERRLEIGGDILVVSRPFASALADVGVRYGDAIGWGVHLHWDLFPWLRLHPYFVDAHHDVHIPHNALTTDAENSIPAGTTYSEITADSFAFGAKLAPTLPLSDRARAWISAGVGWGRLNVPAMVITDPAGAQFDVRKRDGVFVEFPIGIGVSYDVIPQWLAIEYEASAAPITSQSGTAHETVQAVDADGATRDVGPLGAFEASFVQRLGLTLIL